MTFVAKGDSNHWLVLDNEAAFGGDDGAAKPLELLLVGLAGCTAMDVVSILRKKRAPVTGLRVVAAADRADEHPRVFTSVHITYYISGPGVNEHDVAEAVRLSQEKYCAAAAMLSRACPLTWEFHLER